MRKGNNLIQKITFFLFFISISVFVYNLFFYSILNKNIINNMNISYVNNISGIIAAISLIILFIFNIFAILAIVFELKIFPMESIFRSFLFFLSIISFIMIFGDFALLNDITKEYFAGLSLQGIISEFVILYLSQILHLTLFIFFILFLISKKKSNLKFNPKEIPIKDEAIFIDAQYIGIFTGILGLLILISLSLSTPLWAIKKGIITVCILLVLPYAVIVIYWLIIKIREKITEWYDEKQFQDVTKAGLISFLSSVFTLMIIFLIQNLYSKFSIINIIWFPLYFFLMLLIFSGAILHFNKKVE